MASPEEQAWDLRRAKQAAHLQNVCNGGLEKLIQDLEGDLLGFSAKCTGEDWLITIRANFKGNRVVAFVGASTLENVLSKAYRQGKRNELRWKEDSYALK